MPLHEQPPAANPAEEDLSNLNSNTSEFAWGGKIHQGGGQTQNWWATGEKKAAGQS